jgi:hypothetical protein
MHSKFLAFSISLLAGLYIAPTHADPLNPDISAVLDGFYKQQDTALSSRDKGFGLGHTELSLAAPVDDLFEGRVTTVIENHDGETELMLEEAFLQTSGLPMNFGLKAGRFQSQVGYLNSRHLHEDSFSERPAAYRAMLGSHYFDDGAQLSVLLPAPFFWQLGAEVFDGGRLSEGDESIGVYTLNTRLGDDIGDSQSWQLGMSYLHNRNSHTKPADAGHGHDEHGHDHDHDHSIAYSGKNLYIADLVWKWAPNGNNRQQQLVLSGEYLYGDKLNQNAGSDDTNRGWYASVVYRFAPQWSAGARYGRVDLSDAHGDHFHGQQLKEAEFMLAWNRSHFSTLRLQYTRQSGEGFDQINNALTLQYVVALGAHGAHGF